MSLDVVDVRHAYNGRAVLNGVTFSAHPGQVTCLVGASGSGKTTLLRLAAGMIRLQAGEIRLNGELLSGDGVNLPPERRDIGLVFQEGALFPHLDVAANVAFGLQRMKNRRERVAEMLQLIGLASHAALRPHQLSGGQQQRVALARALAPAPGAILLDEPFASLDAQVRVSLRREVRDILNEQNAISVLVTHDPSEAMEMADRIVYLENGAIVQAGSPDQFYDEPATVNVARTFSTTNIIEGYLYEDRLQTELGDLPLTCLAQANHARGPVQVALRSEALSVLNPEPEPAYNNVLSSRRNGSAVLMTLKTATGSTQCLRVDSGAKPNVGDSINLLPAPGSVLLFPVAPQNQPDSKRRADRL